MNIEKIDAENKEAIFQALVDTVGESISVLTKIDLESTMLYLAGCLTAAVQEKMLTVASFPLPKDHWLYAPREYDVDAENPKELPSPILTHALRAEVVSAIRYAIRGTTMCGKETDFDPDALVQNAVYALCGPYGSAALAAPAQAEAPAQAGEPWYGHKFKESQSGIWRCECGKTVKEATADWLDSVQEDVVRMNWLDTDGGMCVFHIGKTWYTRPSYGLPHRKRTNLRAAIDAAIAAQQGEKHE